MSDWAKWSLIGISLLIVVVHTELVRLNTSRQCQKHFISFDLPGAGQEAEGYRLNGRPVLLHFWATWCPSCIEELPGLNSFADQHAEFDVILVAVNDSEKEVITFLNRYKIDNARVFLDGQGKLAAKFCVFQFPESYFFDQHGQYRYRWQGAVDWDSVELKEFLND